MHARPITLVVVAALIASPLAAAEKISNFDRFQLWADCEPIALIVEKLEHKARFGLTKDAVLTTVRSRLRAARIYDDGSPDSFLHVEVGILRNKPGNQTYVVGFKYHKVMKDAASGVESFASVWNEVRFGYGDHVSVLAVVSRYADKFIDEYLRVNRDACEKRPPTR